MTSVLLHRISELPDLVSACPRLYLWRVDLLGLVVMPACGTCEKNESLDRATAKYSVYLGHGYHEPENQTLLQGKQGDG